MHNKIFKRLISFFAVFALISVLFVGLAPKFVDDTAAASAINDATVQKYEAELAKIAAEQKALQASLNTAKKNEANAEAVKTQLDRDIALSQEKIQLTTALIAELESNILEKNDQISAKSADIDEQYENLKTLLRLAYEEGDASYLDLILGSENFHDFLVRTERISSIVSYNTRSMKQYQEDKAALEEEKAALDALYASQVEYKASLETEEKELKAKYEENEKYLSSIKWTEEKYKAQILENQKKEQALDAELEAYIKEQQAKNNAKYYGGEFIWPVDATKWKRISSQFGWRDLYGVKDFHLGIDIPCYTGESVWASNGGTVIVATYHWSYGNYVVIDHGGGLSTLYAHNSKLLVKVGDKVTQKQVIALAGNTGNSYGSHCHFEVRLNGERQQPLNYVKQPK